jgi:hypothetical protein
MHQSADERFQAFSITTAPLSLEQPRVLILSPRDKESKQASTTTTTTTQTTTKRREL